MFTTEAESSRGWHPRRASGPPLVFVNKVLLEDRLIHLLTYYLLLFSCFKHRADSHDRDEWPQKLQIFSVWPFTRKKVADTWPTEVILPPQGQKTPKKFLILAMATD